VAIPLAVRGRGLGRRRLLGLPRLPFDLADLLLCLAELADGEELEHAVLDVTQRIVVLVQDLGRRGDVEMLGAARVPRQLGDGFEIGADHLRFHGLAPHAAQTSELAVYLLAHHLRQLEGGELLPQIVDLLAGLALAELLLNGPELLAQEHLALAVAQLLLDLGLDVLLCLEHAELPLHVHQHPPQPLLDGEGLEQHLPLGLSHVRVAGHQVGQPAGIVHALQHLGDDLLGQAGLGAELGRPLAQLAEQADERRILRVERLHLLGLAHHGLQIAVPLRDLHRDAAMLAVEEELNPRQAALERTDAGHRADGVEHLGSDLLDVLALGDGEDQPLGRVERRLDSL
jgi:hypothetical protein